MQLTLVLSGRTHSRRELRAELMTLGHACFSEGDSKVILNAFYAWAEDAVTDRSIGCFPVSAFLALLKWWLAMHVSGVPRKAGTATV